METGDKFIDGVIELANQTGTRVDITQEFDMVNIMRYWDIPYDCYFPTPPKKYEIDRVIFNPPATIVYWKDGSKTVVKVHDEDFDEEKGFAMAVCRKLYGRAGTERIVESAQRRNE